MVDLSHHINTKSKARHPSPLKDIIKFMAYDGMVSFAGGLPHPSLFPLEQAKFDCLSPAVPLTADRHSVDQEKADELSLKFGRGLSTGDLDLTQFLQYGSGAGNRQLIALAKELTEKVHSPPCEYECLLHPGNTNAWAKVVGLLCEDDDFVIVEEFTYPSAQALWIPMGIKAVPVAADAAGIMAKNLRTLLLNWDERERGARRPRVLYLVPVGSNPTGITISTQRRREIYKICVECDIIIVEDDPYYFLQYPGYGTFVETSFTPKPIPEFLKTLVPTFLSMDTQGRVIRLDSFSKTLFPGLRLGFVDPGAGMFVWCKFYFDGIDRFMEIEGAAKSKDPEQDFSNELWQAWATELVLLTPGSYYHAWQGPNKMTTAARGADPRTAHFRFSFATPTKEEISSGVARLAKVIAKYWK
ncbi:hypothetical protein CSAL01_04478 [Colletotrichum salicis]|uniref:Aminotransferase class I/classII large domain-containing protein n=1 Tax=Colletotrichum salicis TaxID=1209931 RepID=A0A135RQE6_9PEZI|nr:hypothetical protein CSAL01_04478 [Colletotrichum salicis]